MTSLEFLDFAYQRVSAATFRALKAADVDGVLMYLSDTPGKGMTDDQAQWARGAGLIVGALYETSATAALGGRATGRAQATAALRIAKAIGYPAACPIIFALDSDFSSAQMAGPVSDFVRGLHDVAGPDGEYGGYNQLGYLLSHNLADAGRLFQTYAWSGGKWLPTDKAPMEQYHNGVNIAGINADRTRVTAEYAATLWQPTTTTEDDMTTVDLTPAAVAAVRDAILSAPIDAVPAGEQGDGHESVRWALRQAYYRTGNLGNVAVPALQAAIAALPAAIAAAVIAAVPPGPGGLTIDAVKQAVTEVIGSIHMSVPS